MRVAALGRTKILYNSILNLEKAGHEIVLIGTCNEAPEYSFTVKNFEDLAKDLGAQYFCNPRINSCEVVAVLREVNAEIAISINWLTVVGQEAIDAFPMGILNAHAGDLPRFRGNACPNWAIIAGEEAMTITIHRMKPGELDSGDSVLKRKFLLTSNTTIGEIYAFMEHNVPEMFVSAVGGLANGQILPMPQSQNPEDGLRCYPRIPSDSLINWNNPAVYLDRLVRASSEPFSGAYTYLDGKKLIVWKGSADVLPVPSLAVPGQVVWRKPEQGSVGVATVDGVLVLYEVQIENGQRQVASEAILSSRTRLGLIVEDEITDLRRRVAQLEALYAEAKHGIQF